MFEGDAEFVPNLIVLLAARSRPGGLRDAQRLLVRIRRLEHRRKPSDERTVGIDRKSTRLNSSHSQISYAVFCLKKKKTQHQTYRARSAAPRVAHHLIETHHSRRYKARFACGAHHAPVSCRVRRKRIVLLAPQLS